MKLMYALWSGTDLHGGDLRSALLAAGAQRYVVEVDDEHVAEAQLRLTTYDDPVHAVLSVWTEGDPEEVTRVLVPRAHTVAGWVVEERTPLSPPAVGDGSRVDALVNVALLRIPEGMSRETWRARWLDDHTPVAIETQATFGYVQNVVVEALLPGQGRVDAIVEEFFPMAATTDFHAFYGSGGDEQELARRMTRMLESVGRFGAGENIDVVPTSRYEHVLSEPADTLLYRDEVSRGMRGERDPQPLHPRPGPPDPRRAGS